MAHSTSSFQARVLAAVPLSDPNFFLTNPGATVIPLGGLGFLNVQYNNNSADGYDNEQVAYSGPAASLITSANPEVIGTVGAANAGFPNATVSLAGGAQAPQSLTMTMTGDKLGDTYESVITFDLSIA